MPKDSNQGRIIAGRYRLRGILGAGAQGTVYLAEDLGRDCVHIALKLIEGLVGGERQEPADEILRHFRHPNWASVLDAGPCGEEGWFQAVEFVPGTSLDHVEGPQPIEHIWALLEDGARVLGALHRLGVLHYDVTPGNLMLDAAGDRPRFALTDGGLAHVGPVEGVARGTPLTMAPEVTEASEHDHRADLYSLGLVAFQLATGRMPLEGNAGEVLGRRRREEAPRARSLRKDMPTALDDLLAMLLARNPKERPHDAFALLEALAKARGEAVPRFRHEEGLAAAEGGALVGGTDALARIRDAVEALRARRAGGPGRMAAARAPRLTDPVLVVRGRPSSGATRMTSEAIALARADGVPALLLSGRESAGERRGPLRHLADGMATLDLAPDEPIQAIRLGLSARRDLGREERSHAHTRMAEQFVRAVEVTARRAPFLLVVQDFGELPEDAQEAIRVLSRHLLALRENGGSASAPPIVLMLDVGDADAESLLVPDAAEPARPFLDTAPLDAAQLLQFVSARFPGLTPEAVDVERMMSVSEGLPGTLAALLAEGSRRGDLRYESGRWCWNVDALERYEIQTGLTPRLAEALRHADDNLRTLLAYLTMVESPLAEPVVQTLWNQLSDEPLPTTPLIRTVVRDDARHLGLATRALRPESATGGLAEPIEVLRARLLSTLNEDDGPTTALDLSRLLQDDGQPGRALEVLSRQWSAFTSTQRSDAQATLAGIIRQAPSPLDTPHDRWRASQLLEFGTDSAELAGLIAAKIEDMGAEAKTALGLTWVLWGAHQYSGALEILTRMLASSETPRAVRTEALVLKGQLLLRLHRESEGRTALREARPLLREARRAGVQDWATLARFYMGDSQARFLRGLYLSSLRSLAAARACAKRARAPALVAQVYSNLGIAAQALGQQGIAARHFDRSLRVRRNLGDVNGTIATLMNLGRLRQNSGSLVLSASMFQEAANHAIRYAQTGRLSSSLLFLARIYDQQMNSRLAAGTMFRAVQAAQRVGDKKAIAIAAAELAPLSSSLGDARTSRAMLSLSGEAALARVTSYARATHHFSAALSALHMGSDVRAAQCFERALRHADGLYETNLHSLGHLARLLDILGVRVPVPKAPRPRVDGPSRFNYRTGLWLERVVRQGTAYRAPPVDRFLPQRNSARVASGRDRRLLAEAAIRSTSSLSQDDAEQALLAVERYVALTGERYLQGRALALRSTLGRGSHAAQAAQLFSRAIQLADIPLDEALARRHPLPQEHSRAHKQHAEALGEAGSAAQLRTGDSHALAHRLLLKHGFTAAPDERVASALRRVLAATGRMNAGAGLDDLLQGMTEDTIEITGAERACVVLLDSNSSQAMRVEKGTSSEDLGVEVEDLSQTVIQRVIDSQTSLLLHDVFDDQELMGRPSITSLSLRSILCVPMLRGDTLFGVLYADSASAAGSFDQVDQEVLALFSEQAAAALETHRLVSDVQNSMAELKSMQERLVRGERLRTMGELSSGVAHEFNNLLTSILARVQLISLDPVSPELKVDLDLIEKACMDAAAVVRRLQSFTRKEREGDFVALDLAEICNDAVEFLRPLWSTRRRHGRPPITVKLRCDKGLRVEGDATELREVVTNLLKNSLEALADGGHIDVEARAILGGVTLRIEDNGPGIPEDIKAKIFDPFFTTKGERGTGLGLCLSQQIVERHGGDMGLWTQVGEGTRFTIELPLSEEAGEAAHDEDGLSTEPAPLRVLVVDDDENVLGPLCRFLKRSGYALESAADGAAGLEVAGVFEPDVIISDVAMPTMNGIELCREVRRDRPDVPVILMSGWTSGIDPSRARRAGATALLKKPFALEQVASALRTIARERDRARA